MTEPFDAVSTALANQGVEAATEELSQHLRQTEHYHELFDLRLLQARVKMGLPAILTKGLDDLEEPLRTQMEEAYLAACREVGHLFLSDGRVREAWMYLRPTGDKADVADALQKLKPDEENTEQIIEIALHEGVCPRLGFQLVLANYGTCNAISMFDAQMQNRPRADRQEVAALLVRHLHSDLVRSLRDEVTKKQGAAPAETTIAGLTADRDWLFDNNDYHIDTSHLASVVRFALNLDQSEELRLAVDLTEYGRRLSHLYQFAGQEPFVDTYPSHALFFKALLGDEVEKSLEYFRERATSLAGEQSAPAEVYVGLLSRLGRHAEAFDAAVKLLPSGARTSGFAPSLLELASLSQDYARLMEVSRERLDLLGFTMGLVEQHRRSHAS